MIVASSTLAIGRMDRYVVRAVFWATLGALVLFLSLTAVVAFTDELSPSTPAWLALQLMLLTLPRRLVEVAPFAGLIGVLAGLSALAAQHEITAMRAAGVSVWRLTAAAMVPALLLGAVSAATVEFWAMASEQRSEALRALHKNREREAGDARYWHREGNSFAAIEAFDADGGGRLLGITRFDFAADGSLAQAGRAASAAFEFGVGWRLTDETTTEFKTPILDVSDHVVAVRTTTNRSGRWPAAASADVLYAHMTATPSRMPVTALWRQIRIARAEGMVATEYQLALYGRLVQPFALLTLVLGGVALVLGPLRTSGLGSRLAAGVLLGVLFKYVQDLAAPMSVLFGVPAAIAVGWPVVVTGGVGGWVLRRVG